MVVLVNIAKRFMDSQSTATDDVSDLNIKSLEGQTGTQSDAIEEYLDSLPLRNNINKEKCDVTNHSFKQHEKGKDKLQNILENCGIKSCSSSTYFTKSVSLPTRIENNVKSESLKYNRISEDPNSYADITMERTIPSNVITHEHNISSVNKVSTNLDQMYQNDCGNLNCNQVPNSADSRSGTVPAFIDKNSPKRSYEDVNSIKNTHAPLQDQLTSKRMCYEDKTKTMIDNRPLNHHVITRVSSNNTNGGTLIGSQRYQKVPVSEVNQNVTTLDKPTETSPLLCRLIGSRNSPTGGVVMETGCSGQVRMSEHPSPTPKPNQDVKRRYDTVAVIGSGPTTTTTTTDETRAFRNNRMSRHLPQLLPRTHQTMNRGNVMSHNVLKRTLDGQLQPIPSDRQIRLVQISPDHSQGQVLESVPISSLQLPRRDQTILPDVRLTQQLIHPRASFKIKKTSTGPRGHPWTIHSTPDVETSRYSSIIVHTSLADCQRAPDIQQTNTSNSSSDNVYTNIRTHNLGKQVQLSDKFESNVGNTQLLLVDNSGRPLQLDRPHSAADERPQENLQSNITNRTDDILRYSNLSHHNFPQRLSYDSRPSEDRKPIYHESTLEGLPQSTAASESTLSNNVPTTFLAERINLRSTKSPGEEVSRGKYSFSTPSPQFTTKIQHTSEYYQHSTVSSNEEDPSYFDSGTFSLPSAQLISSQSPLDYRTKSLTRDSEFRLEDAPMRELDLSRSSTQQPKDDLRLPHRYGMTGPQYRTLPQDHKMSPELLLSSTIPMDTNSSFQQYMSSPILPSVTTENVHKTFYPMSLSGHPLTQYRLSGSTCSPETIVSWCHTGATVSARPYQHRGTPKRGAVLDLLPPLVEIEAQHPRFKVETASPDNSPSEGNPQVPTEVGWDKDNEMNTSADDNTETRTLISDISNESLNIDIEDEFVDSDEDIDVGDSYDPDPGLSEEVDIEADDEVNFDDDRDKIDIPEIFQDDNRLVESNSREGTNDGQDLVVGEKHNREVNVSPLLEEQRTIRIIGELSASKTITPGSTLIGDCRSSSRHPVKILNDRYFAQLYGNEQKIEVSEGCLRKQDESQKREDGSSTQRILFVRGNGDLELKDSGGTVLHNVKYSSTEETGICRSSSTGDLHESESPTPGTDLSSNTRHIEAQTRILYVRDDDADTAEEDVFSAADTALRCRMLAMLWALLGEERLREVGFPVEPVHRVLWRTVDVCCSVAGVKSAAAVPLPPDHDCGSDMTCFRDHAHRFLEVCAPTREHWKRFGWTSLTVDAVVRKMYESEILPTVQLHHVSAIPEPVRDVMAALAALEAGGFEPRPPGSSLTLYPPLPPVQVVKLQSGAASRLPPGAARVPGARASDPPPPPAKKKRGRPAKISSKTDAGRVERVMLWRFLLNLLEDPRNAPCIHWVRRDEGIFRIHNTDWLARLWGRRHGNPRMTYEKMARAMRTYYRSKVLQPVPRSPNLPRKLVYKFNPAVIQKVAAAKLAANNVNSVKNINQHRTPPS